MKRRRLAVLLAAVCVAPSMFGFDTASARQTPSTQIPPMPPRSVYEPPAFDEAASIAASTKASPKDFLTHFEKSNFLETGRYAESLEFARKLEKASPFVRVVTLGKTAGGHDLVTVVVSKDKAFTPEAAAKTGKPVVLIQNGIHSGEIAGKDATAMLLRDIVVTKKFAAWLDHVIILNIPVFNIDGHERVGPYNRINQQGPREMGFRVNALRLNLNRDYVKADAPEMRAWLKAYTTWLPDFFMDNHVTDGMDYQYDVTVAMTTGPEVWPTVGDWSSKTFLPALFSAMNKDGHIVADYVEPVDDRDLTKGVEGGPATPRFSTGYTAIQNRPGLLVETHSLKRYRTQVWSHYDIMRHTLDLISANPRALKAANAEADRAVAALAAENAPNRLYIDGKTSEKAVPFLFKGVSSKLEKSEVSGTTFPVYGLPAADVPTKFLNGVTTTAQPSVPLGYIVPAQWTSVIELLTAHGVKFERLKSQVSGEFEFLRFSNVKWAERPFEGRHRLEYSVAAERARATFSPGDVFVPMNQRAARVAFNILEPEGPDSAVRWGFMNSVFEQKEYFSDYVFEPMAAEMLKRDPKLKAEFEARLRTDAKFAANPQARLYFLYTRSPYFERDKDLYPVVRVVRPMKN